VRGSTSLLGRSRGWPSAARTDPSPGPPSAGSDTNIHVRIVLHQTSLCPVAKHTG